MTESPASCPTCGAPLPGRARFCPECGTAVGGDTVRAEVPPHETSAAPATVQRASPRWFGVTPPTAALGLGLALFIAAGVLLAVGLWIAGLVVLGLALLCAAAFLEAGRRKPDAPVVQASVGAFDAARARAGAAARSFATRSSARREIARRRAEALRLAGERERLLRDLGAAVYRGEHGKVERERIAAVDERVAALEREAAEVAVAARERVEEARLEVQRTEVVRPPDHD